MLAAAGAEVIVASRNPDVSGLNGVVASSLDVTSDDAVDSFFAQVGVVDHVVTTAGSARMGRITEMPLVDARHFIESKLLGTYRVARAAAKRLRETGSLTLFAGAAARRASPGFALGAAINAAIEALAPSLAAELAPVRVNVVSPGIIDTPIWRGDAAAARDEAFAGVSRLPLRRLGRPDEVAASVLHLMTATFVTGSVLTVDGGYLASPV
jgi:NAD(P)-dependent dehydrogenase (short-subunit alcohol dehydrogenase family)